MGTVRFLLWRLRLAAIALSVGAFAAGSCDVRPEPDGFVPIFDGETLSGWRAVPEDSDASWSVNEGVIQGVGLEDRLSYLVHSDDEDLGDFELKLSYCLLTNGNTGIEIRARLDSSGKRPFEGYHADLGHVGIGPHILGAWDFHFATREEHPCPRGTRLVIDANGSGRAEPIEEHVGIDEIRVRNWNRCHVIARGNHLQFLINGVLSSEFIDGIAGGGFRSGFVALQLHERGTRVQFKDIVPVSYTHLTLPTKRIV